MKPFRLNRLLAPLACGLLATISGCDKPASAGGSDEIDTRLAVDRSGHPIVGARIALVKAGDSMGKALAISATGSDGSFPSFVVPDGFYSVLLRDPGDSLGRFVDSVKIISRKAPAGRDTLLSLGTVRGVVRLGSGDSPTSVTMGLFGTDILANVKADGTFRIELVPGGLYTLGAVTSLDGYGRLYKRIHLADGQNLVLADTLVLPYSGLPIPAGLRVLQDTATGNVRVSWNQVVHPDLLGYVLERVEKGNVTLSEFLTDTVWTDALGTNWERMPLYGPWPTHDVAYRVRSRSLSGVADTKNAALAITATPPEWTKRVDSVKVSMTTDSVTGVTTLKWNPPQHPDLVGWRVIRRIDGVVERSSPIQDGIWSDSAFPDPTNRIVLTSEKSNVVDRNPVSLSFVLVDTRDLGVSESFVLPGTVARSPSGGALVSWRDSVDVSTSDIQSMTQIGDWISIRTGKTTTISHDGTRWWTIPDSIAQGMKLACDGDSVWAGRYVDSLHFELGHRSIDDRWTWEIIQSDRPMPSNSRIVTAGAGYPIVSAPDGTRAINLEPLWGLKEGRFESFKSPGLAAEVLFAPVDYVEVPVDSISRIQVAIDLMGNSNAMWSIVRQGVVVQHRRTAWEDVSYLGAFSVPAILFGGFHSGIVGIQGVSGDSWVVRSPTSTSISDKPITVFRDEIWTVVDGHLWKGKLNLPK